MLSSVVDEREFVDQAVTLRILAELGYVAKPHIPVELLECDPVDLSDISTPEALTRVSKLIRTAESVSHL